VGGGGGGVEREEGVKNRGGVESGTGRSGRGRKRKKSNRGAGEKGGREEAGGLRMEVGKGIKRGLRVGEVNESGGGKEIKKGGKVGGGRGEARIGPGNGEGWGGEWERGGIMERRGRGEEGKRRMAWGEAFGGTKEMDWGGAGWREGMRRMDEEMRYNTL